MANVIGNVTAVKL